ncbi:MAG TPA: HD domain-containing protein [Candidatus Moranbacteria bacterium]|nr:HD domain-containing protein [Candidatus Moranbacteria bacterium]
MKNLMPDYVSDIIKKLETGGFKAFVVGGCVRDLMLNKAPKDWDIATNAKPEEVLKIFPDSVYENQFGTVGIKIKEGEDTVDVVEITTYRIESKYTDKRHPDEIKFAKTLEEDLSRRDFTINSLAIKIPPLRPSGTSPQRGAEDMCYEIIDPFDGQKDLKSRIIRAVGNADDRFNEDALRMMRAVRFASTLNGNPKSEIRNPKQYQNSKLKIQNGWEIENNTFNAIRKNAGNLKFISAERIRDEFEKIILSDHPAEGVIMLHETGLLRQFIPEFEKAVGMEQGFHHYDGPYRHVFDHLIASLEKCPSKKLEVRLASLLHDIGKPQTKGGSGKATTFYNHQYAGAKITRQILSRLRFSRETIDKTVLLVQNHMFYYNVDEVGEAGVRRVVRKVGMENINDLIDVRIADRLGSGVKKAVPYKLRHFKYMVEKVSKDPISVKQLKINGNDLIRELKMQPGPKIGGILDVLLAEVIEKPELNDKKDLLKFAKKLLNEDLSNLREMAKNKIKEEQKLEDEETKGKYWVK